MIRTKGSLLEAYNKSTTTHRINDKERVLLRERLCLMYSFLASFCEERGLSIFVGYGTLLGAIRHKGFIPWDDDFDVMMPRSDYDKLIKDYSEELPECYRIYAPQSKYGPICRFAKFVDITTRYIVDGGEDDEKHGIFIDIFPLENGITSRLLAYLKLPIILCLMYIADSVYLYRHVSNEYLQLTRSSRSLRLNYIVRHCVAILFSFIPARKWYLMLDSFAHHRRESPFISETIAWSDKRCIKLSPKSYLTPLGSSEFESIKVKIPKNYTFLLESWYSDWQTIPQEKERWQHFVKTIKLYD